MVFSSVLFLFVYLPAVLLIYYATPLKWRNLLLLAVNIVFYGWGEPVHVAIMFVSIVLDYICGHFIGQYRESQPKKAKRFVALSVGVNLGILFFFKYADFLLVNLQKIPGLSWIQPMGIALPIGISFYTFQTMSYTIDVYRGEARVNRSLASYGTFVTLFPQLIAGPILQYRDLDRQLEYREYTMDKFASGVSIFCVGLAKKVLLANNIGMLWDTVKATPMGEMGVLLAWLGIIAYTFQIYFDFSGYSDMAVGLGRMLGFEFMQNFNYPYISRSITEFWRRWHISLGSWFRNYLYIPLGGNRCGKMRWFRNIFLVWAATGIWHGASWNFLLWGLYFAVILVVEKLFLLKVLERLPRWISHVYAIILIVVGWVIFAIEDVGMIGSYLQVMWFGAGVPVVDGLALYYLRSYAPTLLALTVASLPIGAMVFKRMPKRVQTVSCILLTAAALLVSTAYLVDATYNPFLYFRF